MACLHMRVHAGGRLKESQSILFPLPLADSTFQKVQNEIMTIAQELERRGEKRGEIRGEKLGEKLGTAAVLKRLLENRFGPLPERYNTMIDAADSNTLLLWSENVLTAENLEEVFKNT